ncbi:MAG: nicotinate-nucleotide pyrophosphorylase [Gammaproteobacteria bacterium SG8_11]|nr:MAG: nicotinate-nucleotide pyrophosphorylase [Gammaproteobacteria bacterium SG8_11]
MDIPSDIQQTVSRGLQEDIGSGDISAYLIDAATAGKAHVISREAAVICGRPWFDEVFRQLDTRIEIHWHIQEGEQVPANHVLCHLRGPARPLLSGERTALNFLQTLSGTATLAHRYAQAVDGLKTKILDTRKTLPGLRSAQKYAVRCGGCHNHRMGLYDAILIKENHIIAAGSITNAVTQCRKQFPDKMVEVEVENLEELQQALDAGAHRVLLDNMSTDQLKAAVQQTAGRAQLEASGNITLDNIRDIAATEVDFISIGGLTKNVSAVDLSMRFDFD